MSAIAQFIRLPIEILEQLDSTNDDRILEREGQSAASYEGSGYVLATLLPYLDENGIPLMESPYSTLASQLSRSRGESVFIFTMEHREAYLPRLSPEHFAVDELRDYFNDFNEDDDPESGQAMLEAIASIRESLASVGADSVIVCSIG